MSALPLPLLACDHRRLDDGGAIRCAHARVRSFRPDGTIPPVTCQTCNLNQEPDSLPPAVPRKNLRTFDACVHRGRVIDRTKCGMTVWTCKTHGTCTTDRRAGVTLCQDCRDFRTAPAPPPAPSSGFCPETPMEAVIPHLTAHPDETAAGWHGWPNVQAAFRRQWPHWLATTPPPPTSFREKRGVVMIGGGERYEIGLYVACRALRHFGWQGPVQLWHRGDDEPIHPLFTPLGVEVIDANAFRQNHPCRRWGMDKWDHPHNRWLGWGLKSYAVVHAPFETVFYQDADWYTVSPGTLERSYDALEASGAGSLVWYDYLGKRGDSNDHTLHFGIHGVQPDALGKGFQGGQWMVTKSHPQAWRALSLYRTLDDYSDYYYRHHYGDQDSMRLAWAMADAPRHSFAGRCWLRRSAMIARGPMGEFFGVHRVADKQFGTRINALPWEALAHQWADEYRRLIRR